MIMIGSNNFPWIYQPPPGEEAAIKAIKKYGTGCASSRFLNGNLDIHEELEKKLARFLLKEAALVFATGYQTNFGAIYHSGGPEARISLLSICTMVPASWTAVHLSFGDIRKLT